MNIQPDTRAESEIKKILIIIIVLVGVGYLCGSALFFAVQNDVRENQNERENRFDIEYHDNSTATIQFTVESERLYADNVTINGQSATRVYDDSPTILPTNQSARVDVSDRDKIIITHHEFIIYTETVPDRISND